EVHACTDVTGFGLLGHLREMSKGSACDVRVFFDKVPFLREVKNLAAAGIIPGGTYNNLDFVQQDVEFGTHTRTDRLLLSDAQTSGGLLIAMQASDAENYLADLHKSGLSAACVIGEFVAKGKGKINVL
ncbi:MAG: selenide, water dikinase SelD, partial [Bacteroidetes bacterium]